MGKKNRDDEDDFSKMDGEVVWRYKLYATKLSPNEQLLIEFYRSLNPIQKDQFTTILKNFNLYQ